jgi:hypothetical protein
VPLKGFKGMHHRSLACLNYWFFSRLVSIIWCSNISHSRAGLNVSDEMVARRVINYDLRRVEVLNFYRFPQPQLLSED